MSETRELSTSVLTGTLKDYTGAALPTSSIQALLMTYYMDSTVINNRRLQNVHDQNDVTVSSSGLLTWIMQPADNVIIGSVSSGSSETHTLHLMWAWGGTSTSQSGIFDTTNTDATVTVNMTSHGLSVGDHVVFVDAEDVGGLNVNGTRVVATVPGANSWTFEHPSAATSTVSGGGGSSITAVKNPNVARQDVPIQVVQYTKAPAL